MDFYEELIDWIIETKPEKEDISKKKVLLCKKHGLKVIPTDIDVYLHASNDQSRKVRFFLQTKPVRTGSGVAVVATMSAPIPCPHGSCTYCPGGPGSAFGDTPKSYTGKEPSTMRGARHDYDPYRIIFNRLEQYIVMGQNPDKVEQIIMGGTFCAFPQEYQEEYVYYSFKAYNDFSTTFYKDGKLDLEAFKEFFELPGKVGDDNRAENIRKKVLALKEQHVKTLEEEHHINETAAIKCIGLTVETKPDWGFASHGLEMLKLGVTRIELGIQTTNDEVLEHIHRGHNIEDTQKSIQELKDLGFKLNFHLMPGLPTPQGGRVSREEDINTIKELFDNPAYRPDMLKIYPCMVMPGTILEQDYHAGKFTPITTKEAADIIVEGLRYIPEYCRLMRVQRDIPTHATTDGVDKTNLRQYVDKLANERGVVSKDIRAREIGLEEFPEEYEIKVQEYDAAGGTDYFISIEGNDKLLGFVRMRFPSTVLHPSITENSALVRELHVYGQAVKVGASDTEKTQHRGIGKLLMARAEEIARAAGKDKLLVISGVGVRGYYRKLGYELDGQYMAKGLK